MVILLSVQIQDERYQIYFKGRHFLHFDFATTKKKGIYKDICLDGMPEEKSLSKYPSHLHCNSESLNDLQKVMSMSNPWEQRLRRGGSYTQASGFWNTTARQSADTFKRSLPMLLPLIYSTVTQGLKTSLLKTAIQKLIFNSISSKGYKQSFIL